MYLAMHQHKTVTIQEISVRFAVSKNHMVKISHQLTKSGLIESTRGRNGGVRMVRNPDTINIEQVILVTEENFDLVECFSESNSCVITDVCKLNGFLDKALEAFLKELRQVSLADLVKGKKEIEKALHPFPQVSIVRFGPRSRKNTLTKS